nr:MJ0042-type zinc finger domain-containing protein [uncultured Sphingomonas sp.]
MILTCPSCGTRYVVKDGAIPPAGRTVRCAQCKHSWHQEPETNADLAEGEPVQQIPGEDGGASDHPRGEEGGTSRAGELGDTAHPATAMSGNETAQDPLPGPDVTPPASILAEQETDASMPQEASAAPEPYPETAVPLDQGPQPSLEPEPDQQSEVPRASHPMRAARMETDDLYSPFAAQDEEETPARRWPLLVGALLFVIALVAAGVYFLAPAELKGRLGLAQGDASTRLTVQVQQHGRTQLASGNQLFEVSGIVRNETDQTLPVPPLNAQLRSLEQQVVYRWTIPISPPQLAPGATASFNSANLDVPAAAACLEVFFGQQRSVPRCRDEQAVGA